MQGDWRNQRDDWELGRGRQGAGFREEPHSIEGARRSDEGRSFGPRGQGGDFGQGQRDYSQGYGGYARGQEPYGQMYQQSQGSGGGYGQGYGPGHGGYGEGGYSSSAQGRQGMYGEGFTGSGQGYAGQPGGIAGQPGYRQRYDSQMQGQGMPQGYAQGYGGGQLQGLYSQGGSDQAFGVRGRGLRGAGPKNYQRSDERIREDVNDRLTDDDDIDASSIEVSVRNCEVTLSGTVDERQDKRRAEDVAHSVSGVKNVQNNLRVERSQQAGQRGQTGSTTQTHS